RASEARLREERAREIVIVVLRRVEVAPNVLANAAAEDAMAEGLLIAERSALFAHAAERDLVLPKEHDRRRDPEAHQDERGHREPRHAKGVAGVDLLEDVEGDRLVLDLLRRVPRKELLHLGVCVREEIALER